MISAYQELLKNSCLCLLAILSSACIIGLVGVGLKDFLSRLLRVGYVARIFSAVAIAAMVVYGGAKPSDGTYTINFHRYDGTDTSETQIFEYGVDTRLNSLAKLGWARRGFDFLGWATSKANADAGKVWKKDWAVVSKAAPEGGTLDVWAVWALQSDSYAIKFVRNDGAGTLRTVGFKHGVKTRMPSLANGLKWARRGYTFKGWELTTADANDNTRVAPWKGDWAYVSTPVDAGKTLMAYARWELTPGYYQIRFNKNDGSGKWRSLGFKLDASTRLSTIGALGWEREGYAFLGWASNASNAAAGKIWKGDGEWIKNVTAEGKTLSIYAVWQKTSSDMVAEEGGCE